ncbi:MAG: type IV secretion protein IcmD [Gammaproteobacteria bacterium]|nr:type IV secretion protein IcmD [Gammaproteobacteria bacterium]
MKTIVSKINQSGLTKMLGLFLIIAAGFYTSHAFATTTGGASSIGAIADQVTGSFASIGKLIIAIAYLAGFGFVVGAIFKFKQHKDNPTQIPMGTPIAMLVLGICLIFLPSFIEPAQNTLFGSGGGIAGGFQGGGASSIPGASY